MYVTTFEKMDQYDGNLGLVSEEGAAGAGGFGHLGDAGEEGEVIGIEELGTEDKP